MVRGPLDVGPTISLTVTEDLHGVIADLKSGNLKATGIDVPIGLPETEPRMCDLQARCLLDKRWPSVFHAPARETLACRNQPDASAKSREITGRGMSIQAFSIIPKIRAIDALMTPELQESLFEVHPEVSFAQLAGDPMAIKKKRVAGRLMRIRALVAAFPDIEESLSTRPKGCAPDDVLDAYVAAWSARRHVLGQSIRLGGDLDARGLRMEMIV